jgi:FMN phosphatase YigB (HAD superfamily)
MRAVGFDLGGTLLHYRRDYHELLADAMRDVKGAAPSAALDRYEEAFYERFRALEADSAERARTRCRRRTRTRWRKPCSDARSRPRNRQRGRQPISTGWGAGTGSGC